MRSPNSRPYRMRRRADQVDQTRQRIVEATVELHGSVGPAATTIAAIAEAAGVTRAPRRYHHVHQDRRLGGHHQRAGRRRDQDQPAAPGPPECGKVLRHASAPGDPEHVDPVIAQFGEHPGDQPAQPGAAVRAGSDHL